MKILELRLNHITASGSCERKNKEPFCGSSLPAWGWTWIRRNLSMPTGAFCHLSGALIITNTSSTWFSIQSYEKWVDFSLFLLDVIFVFFFQIDGTSTLILYNCSQCQSKTIFDFQFDQCSVSSCITNGFYASIRGFSSTWLKNCSYRCEFHEALSFGLEYDANAKRGELIDKSVGCYLWNGFGLITNSARSVRIDCGSCLVWRHIREAAKNPSDVKFEHAQIVQEIVHEFYPCSVNSFDDVFVHVPPPHKPSSDSQNCL